MVEIADEPPPPPPPRMPTSIKLPPFNTSDVPLWFAQVETAFDLQAISDPLIQFKVVVGALGPDIASEIRNIILNPPKENPFATLKTELQNSYGLSSRQRIGKLLSNEELGDRKPSAFLRQMLTLVDGPAKPDETFLKTLFLQRLPANVQTILALAVDELSLEKLALQADRIMEVEARNGPSIAHISEPAPNSVNACNFVPMKSKPEMPTSTSQNEISQLTDLIKQLRTSVSSLAARHDKLEQSVRRGGGGRERDRSKSLQRSHSKPRDNSKFDTCWYHYKFGAKATKCDTPCTWTPGNAKPGS